MRTDQENGSIMLESTFCILLSIFVILFFLSFGFFLYQKTMLTVVTNQVAEEITSTYKLRHVTDSTSINESDVSGVGKYRYWIFDNVFQNDNNSKARIFADLRLAKSSLAPSQGDLSVKVEPVGDSIGRRHYKVTVKQKYRFLLGGLLEAIGIKDIQELEHTAYVESVDVLYYVNTFKTAKYAVDEVTSDVEVLGLIDSVIQLVHSIFDD